MFLKKIIGGGGTASPTKSMSSGSMSMDPNSCREVLTVNVNQINQDLIRQVSSVLSHHDIHNLLLPTSAASTIMQQSQLPNSAYSSHHMVGLIVVHFLNTIKPRILTAECHNVFPITIQLKWRMDMGVHDTVNRGTCPPTPTPPWISSESFS